MANSLRDNGLRSEKTNPPEVEPKETYENICQGPCNLDANWIESMNSTMDDNRLLTLPSNERIRLLPHMKLIFEIRNLKFATPATATRAGIVYVVGRCRMTLSNPR